MRVGDIASHRINFVGTATFVEKLDVGLRLNWVLGRETGENTTVDSNPFDKIDDYAALHLTATYRLPWGLDLQLAVNNLLDTEYFDPSLRNPSGFPIAARSRSRDESSSCSSGSAMSGRPPLPPGTLRRLSPAVRR